MANSLTLVHLSDIHFVRGLSGESAYDLDDKIRNEIIRDARRMHDVLGKDNSDDIAGILVSGDIAFAGQTEEYAQAISWLGELSTELKCDKEYVWCVPGNHDIDQSVLKQFASIRELHEAIRQSKDLDVTLRSLLEDKSTGPLLLAPLQKYNELFAAKFSCLTKPGQLWWEDSLALNDGWKLRLRGINSSLISGPKDEKDTAKMVLGSAQTEFAREDGVEYLTLCHHPLDWIKDSDNAREALCAYSRIQLFGHKHTHRIEQVNDSLWVCAGAVHPVRAERDWTPRYNYISMQVRQETKRTVLAVRVYPRVWSKAERRFVREGSAEESESKEYSITIEQWSGSKVVSGAQAEPTEPELAVEPAVDGAQMDHNRKKLLYHFIGLPYHVRRGIMERLGLTSQEDEALPDVDLFADCFSRARAKGVLEKLWEAIESESTKREKE